MINPLYIPTFISNDEFEPARVLPRVFFYNGLKETLPFFIEGYGSTVTLENKAYTHFPYFDHYNDNTPNSTSRSLLFQNEQPQYGTLPSSSLYTEYWEKYITLLYDPKTRLINCSAIIPLAEYFDIELNDIINFRGNYYHLRAINDYNLSTGECTLQLLGPIIKDTFDIVWDEQTFDPIIDPDEPIIG